MTQDSNTAFVPSMQVVRLDKTALIGTLYSNRDKHQTDYDTAIVGYYKAKIADFESGLKLVKKGEDFTPDTGIVKPSNHSGEYSWAIELLTRSLDNEVHLQQSEFRQFVMDEWNWSTSFRASATSYAVNWSHR